jgi:hypothetical protein
MKKKLEGKTALKSWCWGSQSASLRNTSGFSTSPAYLCRMSTGARVRSRGKTCSCHFTGTEMGI